MYAQKLTSTELSLSQKTTEKLNRQTIWVEDVKLSLAEEH